MEQALTKVTKGIKLGKILIQTNPETKNPELYYLRLPRGIKHDHCVLMDASITTGSAGLVTLLWYLFHELKRIKCEHCEEHFCSDKLHSMKSQLIFQNT